MNDVLIVAPYNAQVSDLSNRLPKAKVGTVDKFQGQQAPVVIYSMTTSSPEDAPRGMEFLYSLNRLNVATSRAQALVIVVGSPRLLEPECRSPRQMQLANALCRYAEMDSSRRDAIIPANRHVPQLILREYFRKQRSPPFLTADQDGYADKNISLKGQSRSHTASKFCHACTAELSSINLLDSLLYILAVDADDA